MAKEATNLDDLYGGEEGFTVHSNKWGEEDAPTEVYGRTSQWVDPFAETTTEEGVETTDEADSEEPLTSSVVTSVDTYEQDDTAEETADEVLPENPVFFLARQAIQDGLIDLEEGEEIPENVDLGFVYNKYVESIRPKAEQAILQEVNQRLQNAGIREENLSLLQAIENGVPADELYVVNKYQKYASVDPESIESDHKVEIIKEWYTNRGLSEKEIKRQLEAIDINDEIDSELQEAQQFFGETVQGFAQQQRQYALQEQQAAEDLQRRNLQIVNQVIDSKEILGEKFTDSQVKELKNYIFQRDRVINVGDQQVPASAYEEFIYRVNNDLAYALRAFKRDTFREKDLAVMKEVAAEEANKDFINAYKKVQDKSSSKTSVKRDDSIDSKDQYGRSIKKTATGGTIIEFG